jgi:HK97 family phage major capsid protein
MASEVTKRLRDRRLNLWEQCKELAESAATENRNFSAEEQGKWDVLQEEMDNLDTRIKSALDAEQRSAEADKAFDRLHADKEGKDRAKDPVYHAVNEELRNWMLRKGPGNSTSGDAYELGPSQGSLTRGRGGPMYAPEIRRAMEMRREAEYRTLVSTNAGSGQNLVPTDFYDQLIAHLIEVSGILQTGPTVLNTAGGENLQIPKTSAHSVATSAGQTSTIGTSDPQFGLVTLSAYKYGILIQVARELLDDSGVDLIGYLAMQSGRALGNKFGSDLVTGAGAGQPTGLLTSATGAVTGATGVLGVPRYSDLVNLEYSVIAPYRQSKSCYWLAKDATIGAFRLIVDTQGRPIWEPSMVLGSPDLLLGKPLVADPFMPSNATGAKAVAFGDFSQFFVRIVGPVRFERSDDFLFGSDLVAFRALIRGDGALVDQTGAIKLYTGATT